MFLTLHHYTLDDHVLSNVIDTPTYWVRLDNIVLTWILGTPSIELHEIIRKPSETAHQACLAVEAQVLGNRESHIL
jgi:hypothetical protein